MSNWINGNLTGKLSVGQGERGKSLEYEWQGTKLGIRQEGEEEYQFVDLAGGGAGREIELQVNNGYIQWKYKGETSWNDLISIDSLKGAKGDKGEQGLTGQVGPRGEQGPKGDKGERGEQGIQGVAGKDGKNGIDGTNGINGQDGVTPNITIGTVTTLEAGQQATVVNSGTIENPIFNFGIPRGKDVVTTLARLTIDNNMLNLTTDKLQQVNMTNNTTINLPQVNDFTEIHLFFTTTEALTITLPRIKWQSDINIEANKTYEFIFTYINNSWLGGCISYE